MAPASPVIRPSRPAANVALLRSSMAARMNSDSETPAKCAASLSLASRSESSLTLFTRAVYHRNSGLVSQLGYLLVSLPNHPEAHSGSELGAVLLGPASHTSSGS